MLEEFASTTSSPGAAPPGLYQPRVVQACFSSVLQGDHLGVEHATCAHSGLLQTGGLLDDRSRLLSRTPVFDAPCHDGLIIDDYFSISRVPRAQHAGLSKGTPTLAKARLDAARRLYLENSLEGSPEKDVENAKIGTIAGAEIDSRTATLDRNLCLVGAPHAKRLALSDLTLDLCSLPATSDSLHACILGSWSSSFTFRRPCFCAFSEAFSLAPLGQIDPENPKVVPLPRKVAEELLLAAALAPLACTDVAAPFSAELFATDASESKGAICSAPLPEHLRATLWKTADRKGGYARIAGPAEVLLKRADPLWEDMSQSAQGPAPVSRPLGYLFDVLVLGKAAKSLHREMCQRGWVVGPLLDQEASPFFSLQTPRFLEWIFFLIEEDRVRCIFAAPPLSPRTLRHAAPTEQKDLSPCAPHALDLWISRLLAVLLKCRPADVAAVVQVPAEAPCCQTKEWKGLLSLPGVAEQTVLSLVRLPFPGRSLCFGSLPRPRTPGKKD